MLKFEEVKMVDNILYVSIAKMAHYKPQAVQGSTRLPLLRGIFTLLNKSHQKHE